ncbi:ribonucleotide reductase, partial [Earliella scabrosa]
PTLRTIADHYLLRVNGVIAERPQFMFLRVALALRGLDLTAVEETYDLLSRQVLALPPQFCSAACTTKDIMPLTGTVDLELNSIPFRRLGACTAAASALCIVNQSLPLHSGTTFSRCLRELDDLAIVDAQTSGKPQTTTVVYMPIWHEGVTQFIRDVSSRASGVHEVQHISAGILIPDIFMERLQENASWTLLDPAAASDLGHLYSGRFTARYVYYEAALQGSVQVSARELWQSITDAQQDRGRVKCVFWCALNRKNNLRHLGAQPCLDASATCSAVGPPGARVGTVPLSLALPAFVTADGDFDFAGFRGAVKQAVLIGDRLNDLVCQVNQSATQHARDARPVCLGVHGLADVFILLEIPFTSGEARIATLEIFETFYNATLNASCELAEGDGPCSTWTGSLGEQGRHYVNMWPVDMNPDQGFDVLRQLISRHGLRNCMLACMPPLQWFPAMHADGEAMDPHYSNIRTANAGEVVFQEVHPSLVAVLEREGLWTEAMAREIQSDRGSIKHIPNIPLWIKRIFRTSWEWSPATLVDMAAERAPFVEQSYLTQVSVPRYQPTTRVRQKLDL